MKFDANTMKRLVIYFMYDKDGIIDDYVTYMLQDLNKNVDELLVVCNGVLSVEGRKKLNAITPNILVRENKGFDVWAYKEGLEQYGWEKLKQFDEIVMMNFTIMGPLYPLADMFKTMNERDLDFWGITKFHKVAYDPFGTISYGYIPEHIQSHFIAVRSNMFNSLDFQNYWENRPEINDYTEAIGFHEAIFTKTFKDKGFTCDTYVNTDDLEKFTYHPIIGAASRLVSEKKCPIFKRRSFMQDYENVLSESFGQETVELYDYIDKHTDYDTNMIWDNILRLENQADIKKNMQLNYVLSSKHGTDLSEVLKTKKVALVIHIYFEDLVDYCYHYVSAMPKEADIYITTDSEKKKQAILEKFQHLDCHKLEVILIENRGRDVSALLTATKSFIMDYDYVCFAHDKKVKQLQPESIGAGFSYKCFENLLRNKEFVSNIISTFEENPRMGLLTPPPPNHGQYYITIGLEWGINYKITKKLAKKLGLHVPIAKSKEPIAPLGTMFWFRPKAMKLLFDQDWKYEDYPKEPNKVDGTLLHAIERIYSYVVQNEGYYPAWLFADTGAGIELTNLHYMVRGLNKHIFKKGSGADAHHVVEKGLKDNLYELKIYRERYELSGKLKMNIGKLYIQTKTQGYSEENTVTVINDFAEEEYSYKYQREDFEEYEAVTCLRWDPCEKGQIKMNAMKAVITYTNGDKKSYGLTEVTGNGIMIDGAMFFLGTDPQVYMPTDETCSIESVIIDADIDYVIGAKDTARIIQLINDGKKLSSLRKIKDKM